MKTYEIYLILHPVQLDSLYNWADDSQLSIEPREETFGLSEREDEFFLEDVDVHFTRFPFPSLSPIESPTTRTTTEDSIVIKQIRVDFPISIPGFQMRVEHMVFPIRYSTLILSWSEEIESTDDCLLSCLWELDVPEWLVQGWEAGNRQRLFLPGIPGWFLVSQFVHPDHPNREGTHLEQWMESWVDVLGLLERERENGQIPISQFSLMIVSLWLALNDEVMEPEVDTRLRRINIHHLKVFHYLPDVES
jgi:hypothetical protein